MQLSYRSSSLLVTTLCVVTSSLTLCVRVERLAISLPRKFFVFYCASLNKGRKAWARELIFSKIFFVTTLCVVTSSLTLCVTVERLAISLPRNFLFFIALPVTKGRKASEETCPRKAWARGLFI